MATRRHSISLSNLAPRLGHPGDLLFQSALGLGAPGVGGGFSDLRRLGSLVLAYAASMAVFAALFLGVVVWFSSIQAFP